MLGTACFRLCYRGSSHCSTTVALSQLHYSSPHPYSTQVIYRPHVGSPSLSRSLSWPRQQAFVNAEGCDLPVLSTIKRSCCHTSLCVEGGHEVSCATIWHGLLPSHHPSILDQNGFSPFKSCFDAHYLTSLPSSPLSLLCKEQGFSDPKVSAVGLLRASSGRATHGSVAGLSTPHGTVTGLGRLAMAASLLDGSWNVAWDVRPARWLHGRHSAWLLFGVCTCFSAGMGVSVPSMLPSPLPHVEGITDQLIPAQSGSSYEAAAASNALQGKQVYTDYTVTGIPGDGRCLFRAIAYGACLRSGKPAPRESLQQELADDLRNKVVDELVGRRSESEWFIEEDFDTYVKRMREPYVWGGEPELLMASHVLKMPITVHWFDKSSEGLISIAEYGSEYGSENPIRVLFHGFGHYDAVQVPGSGTNSKL